MNIDDKLREYEQRIFVMQNQINQLSREIQILKQQNQPYSLQSSDIAPARQQNVYDTRTVSPQANIPNQPNVIPPKKDIEKTIGKSWMGIFASILIFVSVIMFATVLIPNIGNVAKMIIMYAFSIAITSFGIFKLLKDRENKLYLSLTGCGVGLIYISLLVSNIYFKVIGDVPLYVILLIWAAGVCVLSRYHSYLFQIIGQLGVIISLLFGCTVCVSNHEEARLIILTAYFVIAELVFFFSHKNDEYIKNIISHASLCVGAWALFITGNILDNMWVMLIIMLYVAAYNIICMIITNDTTRPSCFCMMYIPFALLIAVADNILIFDYLKLDRPVYICFTYIFAIALLVILHLKKISGEYATLLKLESVFLLAVMSANMTDSECALAVLAGVCLVASILLKDAVYQNTGAVIGIIYILFETKTTGFDVLYLIFGLIIIICMTDSLIRRYGVLIKSLLVSAIHLYMANVLFNALSLSRMSDEWAVVFVVLSVIHMIIMKTRLGRNWKTNEKENDFSTYLCVVNAILMMISVPVLLENTFIHFLVIPVAVGLYLMNFKNLLERKEFLVNMYVGIKFTVLLIVVLASFEVLPVIVSVACLIFAILCILFGFRVNSKALRVYGLVLANLSVIKLILFDISYENTIGHAASFFVCGVLCFAISYIYNMIEKKAKTPKA